jgi:hypothetical protein
MDDGGGGIRRREPASDCGVAYGQITRLIFSPIEAGLQIMRVKNPSIEALDE